MIYTIVQTTPNSYEVREGELENRPFGDENTLFRCGSQDSAISFAYGVIHANGSWSDFFNAQAPQREIGIVGYVRSSGPRPTGEIRREEK